VAAGCGASKAHRAERNRRLLLHLRDVTGKTPHCYFGWRQGNPIAYLFRYLHFGEGDTAPVAHEVLREVKPNTKRQPIIYVGGR
jgi:hypothetical protein